MQGRNIQAGEISDVSKNVGKIASKNLKSSTPKISQHRIDVNVLKFTKEKAQQIVRDNPEFFVLSHSTFSEGSVVVTWREKGVSKQERFDKKTDGFYRGKSGNSLSLQEIVNKFKGMGLKNFSESAKLYEHAIDSVTSHNELINAAQNESLNTVFQRVVWKEPVEKSKPKLEDLKKGQLEFERLNNQALSSPGSEFKIFPYAKKAAELIITKNPENFMITRQSGHDKVIATYQEQGKVIQEEHEASKTEDIVTNLTHKGLHCVNKMAGKDQIKVCQEGLHEYAKLRKAGNA